MKNVHRQAKQEAQGSGCYRSSTAEPDGRPARYDAPPSVLALLRGTWSKRDLLDRFEREKISSFLQRARLGPLTDRQIDAAAAIGRTLGIGFDDPRLDTPAAGVRPAQPWGPLPLRPPGK